ncbi:hypothetical protein PGB90_000775 [Kerria lacca]
MILQIFDTANCDDCIPREYGFGSTVCVCNATYCDTLSPVRPPLTGNYIQFVSSKSGLRFQRSIGSFKSKITPRGVKCKINENITYQEIIGFGGAFTDSAGINILSLSKSSQEFLLKSYFSKEGIEYNLGRVPIGGTDFSTRGYTYSDDNSDATLKGFKLTIEDFKYKIPLIKRAQECSKHSIKLTASCWSPPKWMKTNKELTGFGILREEYYKAYADYHIKFLDAYKKEGIDFWCITTGNEPTNGLLVVNKLNALGWTPISQRKWIGEFLGPAMHSAYRDTCILTGDDQRYIFPWWLKMIMLDKKAAQYINGSAVHWYWDFIIPPVLLRQTHEKFPNLFILNTESSYGDKPWDLFKVALGSWKRAEDYANDIIQSINNWVTGWIDWNLALNEEGGPNWINNYVDSPIIVNNTADEFYKQPMFYALGHFSKFISPGSLRIESSVSPANVVETLFLRRPDKSLIIIILNRKFYDLKFTIVDDQRGSAILNIPKYSISTVIYR